MCAIAGLINCGDEDVIRRMLATMSHRGPDASQTAWLPEIHSGFGHNRLSIIDLSCSSNQPMLSVDGNFLITFNGEIFNYQALRSRLEARGVVFRTEGDTEVLLAAYQHYGRHCLKELDGMFAFAVINLRTGDVFAARDQIGIKPLYYWTNGNRLAFASEIKALLRCPFISSEPDFAAIATPARFLLSPDTGFVGILKLPPGHALDFSHGQLRISPYWQLDARDRDSDRWEHPIDALETRLTESVRSQLIADRPLGAFLSGGLDSSIICALMRKYTSEKIRAFTIRFSAEDQAFESSNDDSYYAHKVAKYLDIDLSEFEIKPQIADLLPRMVWHLDEPLSDPAAINMMLISEAARKEGLIVLLNGVGGDEVFGGYRKHLACEIAEVYQRFVPGFAQRRLSRLSDLLPVGSSTRGFEKIRWLKRFISYASMPEAERYLSSDLSLSPALFEKIFPLHRYHDSSFFRRQQPTLERKWLAYLTRMCLNDTKVFLPEHNLTYSDKASMAAGIETRQPLTSLPLVEFMFRQPPNNRIRGTTQKYLLKKVGERHLPKEVVHRPKGSFNVPLRSWIRGPLADMVDDLLSPEGLRRRGLYDVGTVRQLIDEDRRRVADHSMLIWTFMTRELWFRTFFD